MSQQWFQLQDTFRSVICQFASPIDLYHLALTCQDCYFACSDASIWKAHLLHQFQWWGMTQEDLDQLEQDIILHSHPSMMSIFIKFVTMKEKSFNKEVKKSKSKRKEVTMRECVRFVVGSNRGWRMAEGFCSQLVCGFYHEDYDPSSLVVYRKDMNGIPISIFADIYLNEAFEGLAVEHIQNADSFIYIIKVTDRHDLDMAPLQYLASLVTKNKIVTKFVVGIFWEGANDVVDAEMKLKNMEAIMDALEEMPVVEVRECSLHSGEEVQRLVSHALMFVELFDWKKVIKTLPSSVKPIRKKQCLCM